MILRRKTLAFSGDQAQLSFFSLNSRAVSGGYFDEDNRDAVREKQQGTAAANLKVREDAVRLKMDVASSSFIETLLGPGGN